MTGRAGGQSLLMGGMKMLGGSGNWFQNALTVLATVASYLTGGWSRLIPVYCVLMAIGLLLEIAENGKLTKKSLMMRLTITMLVLMAVQLDMIIDKGTWFRDGALVFYSAVEIGWAIERAQAFDVPVWPSLLKIAQQMRGQFERKKVG